MRQVSFKEAIQIAEAHLMAAFAGGRQGVLGLNLRAVVAKPYGWGFRWQTPRFMETGDPRDAAVGMSPFLVLRVGGAVVQFDSSKPLEAALEEYERTSGPG